ncbi:hypothetical protein HD806DRAFT_482129 [Xylariaceae sp. AK1471]|nr:hypothetical protein HD806DRAFT_482129 [Xylariaceae sp. AK1471]
MPLTPNSLSQSKWLILATKSSVVLFIAVKIPNSFGAFQTYDNPVLFSDTPPLALLLIGSTASLPYIILGSLTGRHHITILRASSPHSHEQRQLLGGSPRGYGTILCYESVPCESLTPTNFSALVCSFMLCGIEH